MLASGSQIVFRYMDRGAAQLKSNNGYYFFQFAEKIKFMDRIFSILHFSRSLLSLLRIHEKQSTETEPEM
jgi:hypothetical protein